MGAFFSELLSQFSRFLSELSTAKRMILLIAVLGGIGSTIALALWSGRPDYQILYSNLSQEDAGAIVARLKGQKVPYKIEGNGSVILVPAKDVYEERLQLAGDGLPQGGGVGFEIFDRTNLGMTEFVQKLNYQRALQGELTRTINQMAEVEQARVHIVTPEKSAFIKQEKPATASVVLKLRSGKLLRKEQVRAITRLVASSVEGLRPEEVTVVDTQGRLLSEPGENLPLGQMSSNQLEYEQNMERNLEARIESMLERVLGSGKAIARVTATLNLEQREKTEERFDPDSQVARSEQRSEEKLQGATGGSGGVPGVSSNVPGGGQTATASASSGNQSRQSSTVNYEINKVTEKVVEPVGSIKQLSVAVLIDGTYESAAAGASEGKYVPRTAEEMNKYGEIVKKAVGYSQARGDQIEVANVAFDVSSLRQDAKAMEAAAKRDLYMSVGKQAAVGVGILLFFLLIVRPILGRVKTILSPANLQFDLPKTVAQLEGGNQAGEALPTLTETKSNNYREQVLGLAKEDPKRTADLIRGWLKEKR